MTAGPTYEPLDQVRRLTNFSTGSLGVQLAAFLNQAKWPILESGDSPITLLLGEQATFRDKEVLIDNLIEFSTTRDLSDKLEALASSEVAAVFHAAAVSDFSIGNVWQEEDTGTRRKIEAGKISSRSANLLAELVPTPKIIAHLRDWFPNARLIGWKYETDGNRSDVLALSNQQIKDNATDYCVANGPAYGEGFGIVDGDGVCQHIATRDELFQKLQSFVAPVA